jgi:Kef-type K+ transport system membrane component KefB
MNLGTSDMAHLLLALSLLLTAAHGLGHLFRSFRQPPVIGEILGGLLLGPTCFGVFLPHWQQVVFLSNTPTKILLGAIYQLGLLLLMFCSGSEIRSAYQSRDRKTVGLVTVLGTVAPFGAGILFLRIFDTGKFMGPAQNAPAFLLVFAIAIAVTSIPVISRILFDLGILETDFARIVLTVAVLEDVILYVVLAVALSIVGTRHGEDFGLQHLLGIDGASKVGFAYYAFTVLMFLSVAMVTGPGVLRAANSSRLNLLRRGSPVAHLLVLLLLITGVAVYVGVPPMFGAFVAGIVAGTSGESSDSPLKTIKGFSFAFFIPIYFAIVGLKLNLVRDFDPLFFLLFLAFACAAKALSVYAGARLAGENRLGSLNLAVAMNARGGPGIVLASVAYDARIINEGFYVILIMLSIVTSLAAGSWLDFVLRKNWRLR